MQTHTNEIHTQDASSIGGSQLRQNLRQLSRAVMITPPAVSLCLEVSLRSMGLRDGGEAARAVSCCLHLAAMQLPPRWVFVCVCACAYQTVILCVLSTLLCVPAPTYIRLILTLMLMLAHSHITQASIQLRSPPRPLSPCLHPRAVALCNLHTSPLHTSQPQSRQQWQPHRPTSIPS